MARKHLQLRTRVSSAEPQPSDIPPPNITAAVIQAPEQVKS